MRCSTVGLGTAALLGSLVFAPAFAAPTGQSLGLRAADDAQNPILDVQYLWDGYEYCWYDFGWRGPGWYVCDYGPWVTGYWWGGPRGWRGWSVARGRRFHPGPDRQFTGPSNRPGPNREFTGPSTQGRPGPNRQFTGPSTQGPTGSGRFEANQGINRPGPGPGPGTVGRGPGGAGGATVGMGGPGRGGPSGGGPVGMGSSGGGGGGPGGGGGGPGGGGGVRHR